MTSRERVITAINHQETDRIPIDLGGFNASTILAEAYHNLLNYLHIDKPVFKADIRLGDERRLDFYRGSQFDLELFYFILVMA